MVAFTYTKAAIVQTLFTTSVIISLAIAWMMGDKVNKKTLAGPVAIGGVMLLLKNGTWDTCIYAIERYVTVWQVDIVPLRIERLHSNFDPSPNSLS